jgi:hypothetical protein
MTGHQRPGSPWGLAVAGRQLRSRPPGGGPTGAATAAPGGHATGRNRPPAATTPESRDTSRTRPPALRHVRPSPGERPQVPGRNAAHCPGRPPPASRARPEMRAADFGVVSSAVLSPRKRNAYLHGTDPRGTTHSARCAVTSAIRSKSES